MRILFKSSLKNIPKAILVYEGYDFNLFTSRTINERTKQVIHWIYGFGIEKNKTHDTFDIHIVQKDH